MATTAVMQGLWGLIESMSLTRNNKKWLADRLIEKAPACKKVYSKEDQEILDGFREALHELKEIKAGRVKLRPLDESLAELRKEMETEGYEFD